MSTNRILRLGAVKDVARFQDHIHSLGLTIPCDSEPFSGSDSPLRWPLSRGGIKIGNRILLLSPHPGEVLAELPPGAT